MIGGLKKSNGYGNAMTQRSNTGEREAGYYANLIASGGTGAYERYRACFPVLSAEIGRVPVIILHAADEEMKRIAADAWHAVKNAGGVPGDYCDSGNPELTIEPFLHMNAKQITCIIRRLAEKLGMAAVSPKLGTSVNAFVEICERMGAPVSLSAFMSITDEPDGNRIDANLRELFEAKDALRVWKALGFENDSFFAVKTVVDALADACSRCGWEPGRSGFNCLSMLQRGAAPASYLLNISSANADFLLDYISEELRLAEQEFRLIVCGLRLEGRLLDYLRCENNGCYYAIVAQNVVNTVGDGENDLFRIAERAAYCFFFKHNTYMTAETVAKILGKQDKVIVNRTSGTNTEFMRLFPGSTTKTTVENTENRYTVMPEEIQNLASGRAVVLEAASGNVYMYDLN